MTDHFTEAVNGWTFPNSFLGEENPEPQYEAEQVEHLSSSVFYSAGKMTAGGSPNMFYFSTLQEMIQSYEPTFSDAWEKIITQNKILSWKLIWSPLRVCLKMIFLFPR